jgi:hypothetical protein
LKFCSKFNGKFDFIRMHTFELPFTLGLSKATIRQVQAIERSTAH